MDFTFPVWKAKDDAPESCVLISKDCPGNGGLDEPDGGYEGGHVLQGALGVICKQSWNTTTKTNEVLK